MKIHSVNNYNMRRNTAFSAKKSDNEIKSGGIGMAGNVLLGALTFQVMSPVPVHMLPEYLADKDKFEKKYSSNYEYEEDPVIMNESKTYFYDRFHNENRPNNTSYHLKMLSEVDNACIEKVDDKRFLGSVEINNMKLSGFFEFESLENDTVIRGKGFATGVDKILKSPEYKFLVKIPQEGSQEFTLKLLPQTSNEDTVIYNLRRKRDGALILKENGKNIILNPEMQKSYERIQTSLHKLSENRDKEAKLNEIKQEMRLILALVYLILFNHGFNEDIRRKYS